MTVVKKWGAKITNLWLIALFVLLLVLVVIFQYDIQYLSNGFGSLAGKGLQVYFLDVGQASATLVILPTRETLLIDTGSGESQPQFLRSVKKILKENKLSHIDTLLLSHSDEDHVGGASAIFEKYEVKKFLRPKLLSTSPLEQSAPEYKVVESAVYERVITSAYSEEGCEIEFIASETHIHSDCAVQIFSCKQDLYSDTNSYCPFITITYCKRTFLLCADAPESREKEFLEDLKDEQEIQVDFLAVAHHGAKDSTSEEFLSCIKPKYAFISAGDKLHPTKPVLDRLKSCKVEKIFCTKSDGMIAVAVAGSGAYKIKTMTNSLDLPLLVCIIFVIGVVWHFYFSRRKSVAKFSALSENR